MPTRDELFTGLRSNSYPSDDQEAAERVSEAINMREGQAEVLAAIESAPADDEGALDKIGATSRVSFEGLIGCMFKDVAQFRRAMSEYRWNLDSPKTLCKNAIASTYKVTAIGPVGAAYVFVLNDVVNGGCKVVNCQLTQAGEGADQDELKAYKKVADQK